MLQNSIFCKRKERIFNNIFLFLLIVISLEYSLCFDCPRDKPIFKYNECQSIYCEQKEFENNICSISNPHIKAQWLNNIHFFDTSEISNIWATSNSKGDLFLISQAYFSGSGDKYILGFNEDGNGLFYNEINNTHYSFETISFPEYKYPEVFHSVHIDEKEYLLSPQTEREMFLIDFKNKNFTTYDFDTYSHYSDNLFRLKGYYDDEEIEDEDERVYFTSAIICSSEFDLDNCYLNLRIFRFDLTHMETVLENPIKIKVHYRSRVNCFQNDDLYIQCIYNTFESNADNYIFKLVISLFNYKTLEMEYNEIIENNFNLYGCFDSSIQLNGNIFVMGYAYPNNKNVIKLLFKKFRTEKTSEKTDIYLEDYLPSIKNIDLNDDGKYLLERSSSYKNSMSKITETKFAILLNDCNENSKSNNFNKVIVILIINIFDDSKISIRHYKINFELYNLVIIEDLRGYNLNNFFGVLLETGIDSTSFKARATFLTFGYVNSTYNEIPIDKNLKENNTNSVIILRDYISEIENNLFGYKLIGIKMIEIPNRIKCGYFINNDTNEIINEGDIVNTDTILRFILERKVNIEGDFQIDFAGVVQEPSFYEMNDNAERVDVFPENNTESEKNFYTPKQLIGRVIYYKFEIRCYESCSGCYKFSNDPNDQQCINCKSKYYFQENTYNCYQSLDGYYLDNTTKKLQSCFYACATCNGPPIDSEHMNCLTCIDNFKYYHSTNCLDCDKYIDPEMTKCLSYIPDGYFLANPYSGVLGQCHEFCKTCEDFPSTYNTNCLECKYENPKFIPLSEGDCPPEAKKSDPVDFIDGECPRNRPILKSNKCTNDFCNKEEFGNSTCVISNSIIKTQWINKIQRFGEGTIMFVSLDYGFNGELFLFAQKRQDEINENLIYGLDKNGNPLFHDKKNNTYYSLRTVIYPEESFFERLKYVKNYENNQTFFISTQIEEEMYVFNNDDTIDPYNFNYSAYSSYDIFTLKKYPEEYFENTIYCLEDDLENCYTVLKRFKFETNENELKIIKEKMGQKKVNVNTNFICLEGYNDYIQCTFTEVENKMNKHVLGLFNSDSFSSAYVFGLYQNFSDEAFFDSMIKLNDEAFIIAFSTEENIIKVLIQSIKFNYMMDSPGINNYIPDIPYINLNEDNYYSLKNGMADRNSLCKINDNKFAILLNCFNDLPGETYENDEILIYIFTIFNGQRNINIRIYSINFKLYNMVNYGKILGYNLNQFFGILIELSQPENEDNVNSVFMTFGYVNTTEPSSINDDNFILDNNNYSKNIKIKNYIQEIENNLFGYEFLGAIILELPDESLGFFVDNNDVKISINQTLDINTEIKLKLNEDYKSGKYYISFAGVVKEPDYNNLDKFAEKTISYPMNTTKSEKDFYTPKILIGKKFKYSFNIKVDDQKDVECYPSCLTCFYFSNDKDNHLCKICKPDYYFEEDTNNCFKDLDEYYYFDEEKEIFSPCYVDCLTCEEKGIDSTHMNCLSCEEDYDFYEKSKNCLKCPKYVNYAQTECIDKIPKGYYLLDESLGTIEKCDEFCKTCSEGPFTDEDDNYHMNCETCLFENIYFKPTFPGDCPSSNEGEKKDDDDEPIDGQCPRYKPILKDNKCQLVYCTEQDFNDKTCQILNNYINIQWLNNFHIFDETSTSYVAYDTNDDGDLFFMAQKEDDQYVKKFIYGFNKNGIGVLYDKENYNYTSFKSVSYQYEGFTDTIKDIQIDNKGYLLNILKDKNVYIIDYNNDEVYQLTSQFFYNIPYTIDDLFKLKDKENTYFFDFIFCIDDTIFDKCYIRLINFKIYSKDNFTLEQYNSDRNIQVNYKTKLTCEENGKNLILCTYTTQFDLEDDDDTNNNIHILGLFNRNDLQFIQSFELKNSYNVDIAIFDSMILLKDNICVIAYSIDRYVIHVIFKKIHNDSNKKYILENYIDNIPYININEDEEYEFQGGDVFRNNLFKINDEEFVILINEFENHSEYTNLNSGIIIIHFKIYNSEKNIIVRHYKIDLTLYNMFVDGDLFGYKLNDFLGVLIELTSPKEKYQSRAAFLTFGYVNSTDDVPPERGTTDLIDNKNNIKINKYIKEIENNLFGYEFLGVKILSLPDESKVGYFINTKDNIKIKVNNIIDINSELKIELNDNPIFGEYYISFAGIVKEPEFNIANNYAIKVENYPKGASPEKYLNQQKILTGKEFKYYFNIVKNKEEPKCYQNCETCVRPSININEQDCLTCKKGFYFKDGTHNCYDKIEYQYYFNKQTNSFSPCYKDCYTCDKKELSSNHMNCKSCHNLYKFYENSTNCLKCPRYVNYLQTECIDTIPDGYFLYDTNLGTIEKCHNLCKTCKKKSEVINNQIHMNCETCLYKNNNLKLIEGNCPKLPGEEKKEEKNDSPSSPSSNNNLFLWISIIVGTLILVIIVFIIICKICCSNKQNIQKNNSDYYNIGGKNIPFEDENSGIN